jgi:predicted ATPase
MFAAMFHQFRRDRHAVQERTKAFLALATEQGFGQLLAHGTILWGWTLAEQGQPEEGIAQIRQGLAAWRAMGTQLRLPRFLAMLAEAYGKAGRAEEGLSVLAEALAVMNEIGEREYEAELYRLKGTLTLQPEVQSSRSKVKREAEECFQKAIEIARKQQAKSRELRTVISLSRLWQRQGKNDEARQVLAEIYGWFTEGFDTKDLQEAKALLEELH